MPPRRCPMNRTMNRFDYGGGTGSDIDDYDYPGEEEEEENVTMMRCLSCDEHYEPEDAGSCKECFGEANEKEEGLMLQIQELKSKVSFLSLSSPLDAPSTTDLVLLPSADDAFSSPVPAHRAVLVSRSPVFRAMLENDMEESRSGTIKISDVSYDSLRAFVNYLYTAEACLDNQMACSLLVLAEKYQVKHLKAHCEKYLISKLNWEKAIANYAFAHRHNANQLLDAALAIILENMGSLSQNEEYEELVENNPRLVVEIYEAYLAKQACERIAKMCEAALEHQVTDDLVRQIGATARGALLKRTYERRRRSGDRFIQ